MPKSHILICPSLLIRTLDGFTSDKQKKRISDDAHNLVTYLDALHVVLPPENEVP